MSGQLNSCIRIWLWGGNGIALRILGYSDSMLLHSISPRELPQIGSHWQVSVSNDNQIIAYFCYCLLVPLFYYIHFSSFLKYSGFHICSGSRVPREILYHWNANILAPDVKDWLICKDPDAEEGWRQEKGMIEDEMVGWYHRLSGKQFE